MRLSKKGVMLAIVFVFCLLFNGTYGYEDLFISHAKAFLATPEGGGEQNALSNYVRAMEQFDIQAYLQHQQTFDQILKNGWTGREQSEMNTLRSLQPILNEIWRGNEKEFVKYPPVVAADTPIPSFLKSQLLGKLMVIQARYCEHINRPDYAMEWYKHAVIFGQRMCDENSSLIAKLISIAIEHIALKPFQQFLIRQNLTKDMYLKIAEELTTLRSSETPLWKVTRQEDVIMHALINGPKVALPLLDPLRKKPLSDQERQQIEFIAANKDNVLRQYEEVSQKMEELLKKGYPEIIRADLKSLVANMPPFLRRGVPNYKEPSVREGVTYARWALTICTAQIRAYRVEKGTLPSSLAALSEIGVTPPLDPFSNHMLKYIFRGNSATLYSIGPDLMDNGGSPEYDPKNGTVSSGDITVSVR